MIFQASQKQNKKWEQSNLYVDPGSHALKYMYYFHFHYQDMSEVLRQLSLGGGGQAIAYRGISEAFPGAKIAPKGIYQEWAKPCPPYALISVQAATTYDDRILAITLQDEQINLNNRSRGEHRPGSIDAKELPVRMPEHESDVGSVILVTFGEKTAQNNFEAICELILLQESSSSSSAGKQKVD